MLESFEVYRAARELHWLCIKLRLHRIHRDQIFRASSSVVLNIAEGAGRRTPDDQRKHYTEALGSLRECQAVLDLEKVNSKDIRDLLNKVGGMLYKLSSPRR